MHDSGNVAVYLHSASRPIFEDCVDLRFAPLPGVYMTPEISKVPNQWDQIDDFKWLKTEPSPNFRILPDAERVAEDTWRAVVLGSSDTEVGDILSVVGIP